MMGYRQPIHDKLITDFASLKYSGTTVNCFADTQKIFFDIPSITPACRISPISTNIIVLGNTSDERVLSFQADVYEKIENSGSLTEANLKIDRLSNIEDSIIQYIEKLPNNLEYGVTNVHITDTSIGNAFYSYEQTEQGVEVYLSVLFNLKVLITPQLL